MSLSEGFIRYALDWLDDPQDQLFCWYSETEQDEAYIEWHVQCPEATQRDYRSNKRDWNILFLLLLLTEEGVCL